MFSSVGKQFVFVNLFSIVEVMKDVRDRKCLNSLVVKILSLEQMCL